MSDQNQRYDKGMMVRRAVLGDAHVDKATAAADDFDRDFQTFITEGAWGSVWARDGLARRDRSLITLAILASLGHYEEFEMHVRASINTGATREDIREVILMVAVYAGVPAANNAIKHAKAAYAALATASEQR